MKKSKKHIRLNKITKIIFFLSESNVFFNKKKKIHKNINLY